MDTHRVNKFALDDDLVAPANRLKIGKRSGYQQKDRKPSQNDKTEHGMEKTVQNQGQSPICQSQVNTEESAVNWRRKLKNTMGWQS
ncbi:hypothetical protein Tco_0089158 [Tanacetum coccineum]